MMSSFTLALQFLRSQSFFFFKSTIAKLRILWPSLFHMPHLVIEYILDINLDTDLHIQVEYLANCYALAIFSTSIFCISSPSLHDISIEDQLDIQYIKNFQTMPT